MRVPRVSNIAELKNLLLIIENNTSLNEILQSSRIKTKISLREYLKLCSLLNWIVSEGKIINLTQNGAWIKSNFSGDDGIESDKKILRQNFLQLSLVKIFLQNVFENNNNETNKCPVCLTKDEIESRYLKYRKISEIVVKRESRFIYNWLLDLDIIEALPVLAGLNNSVKVCYHMIGKQMTYEEYSQLIISESFLSQVFGSNKPVDWIEIPTIRNKFCIRYCISIDLFNTYLKNFLITHPNDFQLSRGTELRNEVKKESLEINDKLFFYIRPT